VAQLRRVSALRAARWAAHPLNHFPQHQNRPRYDDRTDKLLLLMDGTVAAKHVLALIH
jgi:hypothetical protein